MALRFSQIRCCTRWSLRFLAVIALLGAPVHAIRAADPQTEVVAQEAEPAPDALAPPGPAAANDTSQPSDDALPTTKPAAQGGEVPGVEEAAAVPAVADKPDTIEPQAADSPVAGAIEKGAVDKPADAELPPAAAVGDAAKALPGEDAQKANHPPGRLIRVPLPITGSVDSQVERAVERALVELPKGAGRPILVFEFYPTRNKVGEGSDFGRALNLANFLSSRRVSSAKTVAFIPKTIKGHGVLAAMACEEIVMAPDAEIGDAGVDLRPEEAIDPTIRSGYYQIADRRKTIPAQVALGMLDRDAEVLQVETEVSTEFVLRSELDELKRKHTIQAEKVLIPAGQLGIFSGRVARELGFVKYLAADRAALAKALGLPISALEDDPTLGGEWRAIRVPVKGAMTSNTTARVIKMIENQIREGDVNFVCLWLDSPGGSLIDSVTLANYLADLDSSRVRTVAYIPNEAYGDAALVALACDQVVMQRDATLGGSGAQEFSAEELAEVQKTVRDNLAPKKSRSWSLIVALLDPNLRVFCYTHRTTGLVEYFCEEEAQSQPDADQWTQGEEIRNRREALKLTGPRAKELGLARHTVNDFSELRELYTLEDDVSLAEPGWADSLIDALAMPGVALLLLFVGIVALYAELHSPGVGVGAFVAGICFLLFFWSKYLDGTAGWLEALLFLAGLVCILLEIFVLPGTAIFGLGGGLLIIGSLILASQTFVLPHNDYQFRQLRDTVVGLSGIAVCVVLAAIAMRRFFPHSPLFNHMVLQPPSNDEMEYLAHRESLVDFSHLLDHQGVTTTPLGPAGKARFDGQIVDVASRGEFIDRGASVTVVEVHGNRIVVRPTA
jgi:membrane-bound serine protease (ClpP class)